LCGATWTPLKALSKYDKLSTSGTFRNLNFGVKHSFVSTYAFFTQIMKYSEKNHAQLTYKAYTCILLNQ